MNSKLYSIYDAKAGTFAPPFIANSDDAAKRDLVLSLRRASPEIPPNLYPADFSLFALASWDGSNGIGSLPDGIVQNLGTILQIQSSHKPEPFVAPTEEKQ